MFVMNCPNCGMQAQVPPGVSSHLCNYCRRSFEVGGGGGGGPSPVVVVHHTSGWSLYWTIRLGILAVVALLSLGGWIYHRATGQRIAGITDDDDDDWSGSAPLVCSGVDDISVSGIKANFTSGSVINASGNCKVTCKDCALKAPMGIQASGNAQIVLVGGSLEGDPAINASANAKVDVKGNGKVTGPVSSSANAVITGVAPPPAASSAHAAAPSAPPAAPSHAAAPPKPAAKKK
jgi:hypothetical protein